MKNLRDTLALPIVLLVVVIAAAGAAIKLTDDQARAAQSRLTAQQKQLKDAQVRVQKSGTEKEMIVRYLPDYSKLDELGFVGEERRIQWLDALRNANQKGAMFGINYDIAAQQAFPRAAAFSPGQLSLRQSVMKLRFPMLHEDDLPNFLQNLAEQNAGVFLIEQCTVRRAGAAQVTRFQPNMNAECQLAWLTARPATAGGTAADERQ
jgi:type II secretory pathway pseudopilin PulG